MGMLTGVAVGGPVLKGHKIIVGEGGMTFDGEPILKSDGANYTVPGLVELYRIWGGAFDLKRVKYALAADNKTDWWDQIHGMLHMWAREGPLYHLKLPDFQELWIY